MMLQNETEMYNLGLGGNARYCNGHMQVAASMATKKECKSKKAKMVPSKDDLPSPTSPSLDGRLKFSDRLKALLKSGASGAGTGAFNVAASVKDESVDQPDDPYAFSEPEPQVLHLYQNPNPNHTYSRRCVTLTSKVQQPSASPKSSSGNAVKVMSPSTSNSSDGNIGRLYPALSASLGQLFSSNSLGLDPSVTPQIQPKNIVSAGEKVLDDESSKTMNRLQAKIARNKVIGKHRKVRTSGRSSDMSPHGTSLAASTATSTGKNISGARGLWPPQRERSLLEEQLLGLKPEVLLKKESESPPLSSRHAITYRPQMLNHSSHAVMATIPSKRRRCKVISRQNEVPRHEALQRIQSVQKALREYRQDLYPLGVEVSDSEESDLEEAPVHQRHWFSAFLESGLACERESRLGQIRAELRRRVNQTWRGMPTPQLGPYGRNQHSNVLVEALLDSARMHPSQAALFVQLSQHGQSCHSHMRHNRSKLTMLVKRTCSYRKGEIDACSSLALPCTQHCVRHIMYNVDQLLFEHCTAKFSDNTQCCVPVFDICHELPLCMEHARKRDNYDKMCAEIKPKKVRKKAKPSAMTRPSKRGKKKRRVHRPSEPPSSGSLDVQVDQEEPCEMSVEASSPAESVEPYVKDEAVDNLIMAQEPVKEEHQSLDHHHHNHHQQQQQQVEVEVEEVLAMAEELPLDTAELANQASRLLEEHDLTNVLNQIPADAFNDLFTEDKNGQYEPTREETEELERALEAVDKDVKSLEKLSQTQGLLVDTLMDEHALVQTLAQLPTDVPSVIPAVPGIVPVFATYHHHHHNGYVVNSPHAGAIMAPITHPVVETPGMAPTISIQTQTDMPS
ncbi:INO80 complex subunit D isoform X3 [Zootermopsis nevadensis]|uniref:INO80 complex subunit D n=1 Tax=Zootermopsis nevadensis TaxID=136037 RepID=A0A067R7L3_ZOONE|nr:INO80 complex subunit D isoform X3 [Zootermopsis nevadensis]KDR14306.1 INO80 complex subunit D [Zootermopsis nevadensis]